MRIYRIYQTMYLGEVEVPDDVEKDDVIDYMEKNDCWPDDFLEPVDTDVQEATK